MIRVTLCKGSDMMPGVFWGLPQEVIPYKAHQEA